MKTPAKIKNNGKIMAKTAQKHSFESIIRDIDAKKTAPVYLLMGAEPYYIDRISDHIANHVLAKEEQDFNQMVVYAADTTPVQIVEMAKRYPMMAEKQVVIVKEAQNIKAWEPIEKYLENPLPSTVLVICYKNGKIDGRKKIVTKAGSVGVVFESVKKKDNELAPFIEQYLNGKNIKIDRKATLMIADHIGADLNRIASELDKLIVSLKEEQTVTPEIVESQIGISKDYNIFELKSAIINRNIFKAYQIMKYFDKNPKSGSLFGMLPQLFAYFQNLMIAYYVPKNNDEQELARYFGFSYTWQARDYIIGMRNYSGVKTMQIISKIREIDAKSKGLDNPNTSAGELMKELFYFILH